MKSAISQDNSNRRMCLYQFDGSKLEKFFRSLKNDTELYSIVPKAFVFKRFKKVLLRKVLPTPPTSERLAEGCIERLVVYRVLVTPEDFAAATIRAFENG